MFPEHPLTPDQLRQYCAEHIELSLAQLRTHPRKDPAPQMLILYIPPKTARNAAELRDPQNWKREIAVFPDFGLYRRELISQFGATYGYSGHTVLAVYLTSMVWAAPIDKKPGQTLRQAAAAAPQPSEDPRRSEALVTWAQTITNLKHCITYPLTRTADGAAIIGSPRERRQQQAVLLDLFLKNYAQAFLTYANLAYPAGTPRVPPGPKPNRKPKYPSPRGPNKFGGVPSGPHLN